MLQGWRPLGAQGAGALCRAGAAVGEDPAPTLAPVSPLRGGDSGQEGGSGSSTVLLSTPALG